MSATISHLPVKTGVKSGAVESLKLPVKDEAAGIERRIAQLIEIYDRIGNAPPGSLDGEAIGSALSALHEGREQDALELVEIAFEAPDPSLGDTQPEGVADDSPLPEIAQIWRHIPRRALACAGGTSAGNINRAKVLQPQREMRLDRTKSWSVGVGDLEFDPGSCRATIELADKGEIIILLNSGALTIDLGEALSCTRVTCAPNAMQILRLVYLTDKIRSGASQVLNLVADALDVPQGIWFHSAYCGSTDAENQDNLAFVCQFQSVTPATDEAFCEGAEIAPMSKKYRHSTSIDRKDFVRFSLPNVSQTACAGWDLDERTASANILGLMAAPTGATAEGKAIERELIVHEGKIEIIVSVDGATWVAVSPERRSLASDDPGEHLLSPELRASGEQGAVFVTPLVSTTDGAFDVMLLRPNFGHAVWLTPGSQARFVHIAFDDPGEFAVKPPKSNAATKLDHKDEPKVSAA